MPQALPSFGLMNQCLMYMYYVLLFFDNVFFSYQYVILASVTFVFIDNVLFCVFSKSLVTPSSIE